MLIHDAARPNVSTKLIKNIIHNIKFHNAVVPAVKVKDSIKLRNRMGRFLNVDRKNLFRNIKIIYNNFYIFFLIYNLIIIK